MGEIGLSIIPLNRYLYKLYQVIGIGLSPKKHKKGQIIDLAFFFYKMNLYFNVRFTSFIS